MIDPVDTAFMAMWNTLYDLQVLVAARDPKFLPQIKSEANTFQAKLRATLQLAGLPQPMQQTR